MERVLIVEKEVAVLSERVQKLEHFKSDHENKMAEIEKRHVEMSTNQTHIIESVNDLSSFFKEHAKESSKLHHKVDKKLQTITIVLVIVVSVVPSAASIFGGTLKTLLGF